jgi:hypothetical protein
MLGSRELDMDLRFATLAAGLAAGLVAGLVSNLALSSPAKAGDKAEVMRPEEAKRFVANKVFSYTCFDGTSGAGRIHADGSVIGTMQVNGGQVRYLSLPVGTIKVGADSICATLRGALFQPCFNVVQTSPRSFRGSLKGLGFAYCDFVRRNPRVELSGTESPSHSVESTIALRPSRY